MDYMLHKKVLAWPVLGVLVMLLAYALLIASASITAHFFDGYFANGSFQLFDPLRRIAAGQVPGRDFMVFHGIGALLVHYPLFAEFGANLYASEVSRIANTPFFFVLAPFVVAYLASRSMAFAFGTTIVMLLAGPIVFLQIYDPSNSMLGVRSAFAVFACAAFLIVDPRRRLCIATLFIALAIVGSTEHGAAVAIGTLLIGILVLAARRTVTVITPVIAGIALALGIFALFSARELVDLLRYYYSEIPGDQPWYFGADPNPFGVNGFLHMFGQPEFWLRASISLICLTLVAVRLLKDGISDKLSAALVFIAYGVITLGTMNGYVFYGNMEPFVRACVFAALIAWTPKIRSPRWLDMVLAGAFLLSIAVVFSPKHPPTSDDKPVLGVHLAKRWRDHLSQVNSRVPADDHLWADYTGLVEATHPGFQPTSDYIIHALGHRRREEYAALFGEVAPTWVRLNNMCSWSYGTWLLNENWSFYQQIFSSYEPVYSDTLGVLFQKTKPIKADQSVALPLDSDGCVTQTARHDGLWEISMDYTLTPAGKIGLINSIPRYLVEEIYLSGAPVTPATSVSVPLSHYGRHWVFPLRIPAGANVKLCPVVRSKLGAASFSFTRVESRELPVPEATLAYMNCSGKEFAYIAH